MQVVENAPRGPLVPSLPPHPSKQKKKHPRRRRRSPPIETDRDLVEEVSMKGSRGSPSERDLTLRRGGRGGNGATGGKTRMDRSWTVRGSRSRERSVVDSTTAPRASFSRLWEAPGFQSDIVSAPLSCSFVFFFFVPKIALKKGTSTKHFAFVLRASDRLRRKILRSSVLSRRWKVRKKASKKMEIQG